MGIGPARRKAGLHWRGCDHRPRPQDCGALRVSRLFALVMGFGRRYSNYSMDRGPMGVGRQKAYNCEVYAQNDPHDVEVAMKYVLLGNLSPEYASKQSERVKKAKAKLDKLGIKIESIPRKATTTSSTSSTPRIRRRCSRSPSGTPPSVWGGSKVCRPSTQRASKQRSRTQRAEPRWLTASWRPPPMDKRRGCAWAVGARHGTFRESLAFHTIILRSR